MAEMERRLAEERRERSKIMTALTKTEKKFDKDRLKSEAQRKNISRKRLQLPDDEHTQIIEHFRRAQSGRLGLQAYNHYEHAQHNTREAKTARQRAQRGSSKGH